LQRDVEDAQADLEAEQNKVLQQLGQKILAVIERYARDNGYTMVVDVGNPNTPVIYASPSIDITKEIIELYDKSTAALSAPPSATPSAPKSAAPAPKPAPTKPAGQ
jgi:outer membrane protein